MSDNNNGILMESQRPSRTTTGRAILLISNQMVVQLISDAQLPTLDGGNSSDTKVPQLSTRKERSLKFKEELIKKIETLVSILKRTPSINNSTLSMLMNGRVNQPRENSMIDLDSMLREISTSSQHFQIRDTSI
jgi:predicted subunit of tRNA(5-methylaminomethyl-2-thiouridylate) methyltransferase